MKRPPQVWIISFGILCLFPSAYTLRATSLIFSKTTTTTTEAPSEEIVTTVSEASVEVNQTVVTKPPLTGIPQIDYKYDPNLPFELKGYNLSEYPFYDRVPDPDEIDFKCDGLHDGFYASVPHKCQVYHHCLYGTRYDFLCANFTAFDQRTFICHFVSEVDCVNSPNFWHRNDALYQAASTTTVSTTTAQVVTPAPIPAVRRPIAPIVGGGRRRRPFRRRRPQYDYYYDDEEYETDRDREEYYDDPPPARTTGRRRKQRPRPNRRPDFEEYDDYEDERYERRGTTGRDRRPYTGRDEERRYDERRTTSGSKNKDRRVDDDVPDRKSTDRRRPSDDRRRPSDDRLAEDDYDRRSYDRPRKTNRDSYTTEKDDERRSYDRPRKTEESKTERRTVDRPRIKDDDDRRYRPKDSRPLDDEDDRRSYDRPRKDEDNRRSRPKDSKTADDVIKPLIKPSSGSSVYDRPRAAPIIRRPVPKTERDKFDYKPVATTKTPPKELDDEEYYDEYEDEPKIALPKPIRKANGESESREEERKQLYNRNRRPQIQSSKRPVEEIEEDVRRPSKRPVDEIDENVRRPSKRPVDEIDEDVRRPAKRPVDAIDEDIRRPGKRPERTRLEPERAGLGSKKRVVIEEYSDEYEDDRSIGKEESSERSREDQDPPAKIQPSKETRDRPEPIVRVVKRPFLPSRGGNPYVARGLQPLGNKALDTDRLQSDETPAQKETTNTKSENDKTNVSADNNRPQIKSLGKPTQSNEDIDFNVEELRPSTSRSRGDTRFKSEPRTTQKPKPIDNIRDPLDINENEYDVTLNDALNPTIPNLPVRSIPTGFSTGRDGYIAPNYQRSRLIAIDNPALISASSDFVYQVKQPRESQVQSTRYNPYVAIQQVNYRHPSTASGQYYTTYQ